MEVFTRRVGLPLPERGLEYQRYVCFFCCFLRLYVLLFSLFLTWNVALSIRKCVLFLALCAAHGAAEAYTVYLTACLRRCQIFFFFLLFNLYFVSMCEYLYNGLLVGICTLWFAHAL